MGLYKDIQEYCEERVESIHPIDRCKVETLKLVLERLEMVSLLEWKPITEKPVIPEGRYGVSILMISYDSTYDEINPGHGWEVFNGMYSKTRGKDGRKRDMYKNIDLEEDFMVLYLGEEWGKFGPVYEDIQYWCYMPQMVNGKLVRE